MKAKEIVISFLLTILLIAGYGQSKRKKITEVTGKPDSYELVKDWPNLPKNIAFGQPTGLQWILTTIL